MFQVGLFYLDGSNTPVPLSATTAEFTSAAFPTSTHLIDQTVSTPVVQPGDAWAGKPIGIALTSVSGTGSVYWDVDNVRLTQTAVPEPTTVALFGLGLAGLLGGVRFGRRSR
ncbi:MAG: PEP-CTERM sorting domain-containing protein [Verrucomicrobia bacterium]|nr:PEP-CTERM sorting domain-containing protein [Verrucomicrobiota bacterium]